MFFYRKALVSPWPCRRGAKKHLLLFFGFLVWTRVVSLCNGKLVKMVSDPFRHVTSCQGRRETHPDVPLPAQEGPSAPVTSRAPSLVHWRSSGLFFKRATSPLQNCSEKVYLHPSPAALLLSGITEFGSSLSPP